jgi:peptidoglycan/LPS O-acetylase OafA/YrhL
MQPADRLHALDAVRAYALLLGVVLHGAAAFLQGFPIPMWVDTPSDGAPVIYYVIHMFRMSAFFLIAGFFARVLVERRGMKAFVKDRAKRVALPLVLFIFVFALTSALGFVLGALPHGVDYLMSLLQPLPAQPGAPPVQPGGDARAGGAFNLGHLWFLYYLLIFYVLALAIRSAVLVIDARGALAAAGDRVIAFVMRGVWAPVLIALPLAAYLYQHETWAEWIGLPAPFALTPNLMAIVGYGIAFGLGWLLNRQVQLLLDLQKLWLFYLAAAVALTVFCLATIGTAPLWTGPTLEGIDRLLYTAAYVVGLWCWVFAFVGAAVRYLSTPHPVTRYLADASYWVYLMHLSTLIFFITLLRPFDWHWSIKLAISVGGSMPILLLTYHWFVRFTWIGAMLNGRRHPRPERSPPASPLTETA